MNDAINKHKFEFILGEKLNCRQNGFVTDIKRKICLVEEQLKDCVLYNDDITICRKGSLKRILSIDIPSRGVTGAIERCSV